MKNFPNRLKAWIAAAGLLASIVCSGQAQSTPFRAIEEVKPTFRGLAELFSTKPSQEPTSGNSVRIIRSGLEKLDLMAVDMMEASDYIHMEYFEFFRDPGSHLVRLAMNLRGEDSLEVRYIVEDFMNLTKSPRFFASMKKHGVDVKHYSVLRLNRRNHQKIVVVDGKIGYTGGMNIGNHYFYSWDDTHLRLEGPCVGSLEEHYDSMWKKVGGKPSRFCGDTLVLVKDDYSSISSMPRPEEGPMMPHEDVLVQIVASEPGKEHLLMDGYIWMLENCQDYVYIQTPYFTPPKSLRKALFEAVDRGVDVRLVIPKKTDMHIVDPANRSFYRECLDGGVRIFQSEGKFDHSKTFVCDDYLSSIGSANLDGRSLKINHEINTYFYDEGVASEMKEDLMQKMDMCQEIRIDDVERWSAGKKMGNSLARILASQL